MAARRGARDQPEVVIGLHQVHAGLAEAELLGAFLDRAVRLLRGIDHEAGMVALQPLGADIPTIVPRCLEACGGKRVEVRSRPAAEQNAETVRRRKASQLHQPARHAHIEEDAGMVIAVEPGVHGARDKIRQGTERCDTGADPGIAARMGDRDRPGQDFIAQEPDHVLRRLPVLRQIEPHEAAALVVRHPAVEALRVEFLEERLQTFQDLRAERGKLFAVRGERMLI